MVNIERFIDGEQCASITTRKSPKSRRLNKGFYGLYHEEIPKGCQIYPQIRKIKIVLNDAKIARSSIIMQKSVQKTAGKPDTKHLASTNGHGRITLFRTKIARLPEASAWPSRST